MPNQKQVQHNGNRATKSESGTTRPFTGHGQPDLAMETPEASVSPGSDDEYLRNTADQRVHPLSYKAVPASCDVDEVAGATWDASSGMLRYEDRAPASMNDCYNGCKKSCGGYHNAAPWCTSQMVMQNLEAMRPSIAVLAH